MRPGQQKQRSRGRSSGGGGNNNNNNNNNNRNKGQNPLTRTYDSSGPDVKVRGTAQTIAEKYMALARDASSSGDRVMAENYLQHAEHYNRIIAAAQAMYQERFQRDDRQDHAGERQDFAERDDDENDNDSGSMMDQSYDQAPAPVQHSQTQAQPQQHQPRVQSQPRAQAPAPKPQPQLQPQPIIDETTPQPIIEGTPAEVQIETEASSQETQTGEKPAASRRRSASRPRRTPRAAAGAEGEEAKQPVADAPAE